MTLAACSRDGSVLQAGGKVTVSVTVGDNYQFLRAPQGPSIVKQASPLPITCVTAAHPTRSYLVITSGCCDLPPNIVSLPGMASPGTQIPERTDRLRFPSVLTAFECNMPCVSLSPTQHCFCHLGLSTHWENRSFSCGSKLCVPGSKNPPLVPSHLSTPFLPARPCTKASAFSKSKATSM